MPFFEDSVYNNPRPTAGWRILIMRRWPRGVRKDRIDEWLPKAAPSAESLAEYNAGEMDFPRFARRYRAEMRKRESVLAQLRDLEREHGNVILLCWERAPKPCHRHVLIETLNTPVGSRARGQRHPSDGTGVRT